MPKQSLDQAFAPAQETVAPAAQSAKAMPPAKQAPMLRPPSRRGLKPATVFLDPAAHKQLKFLGLELDRAVQGMLSEAVNDFFRKHGKPPLAMIDE